MEPITLTLCFIGVRYRHVCMEKVPLARHFHDCLRGYVVITGVLNIKRAFAGFIDTNVILFDKMFIVGGALFRPVWQAKWAASSRASRKQKNSDLHHYGGNLGFDVWRLSLPVPLRFLIPVMVIGVAANRASRVLIY